MSERLLNQWLIEHGEGLTSKEVVDTACGFRAGYRAREAEVERLRAIANSGHADDCGGLDEPNQRCACGWLQRESAHKYIVDLEAQLERRRDPPCGVCAGTGTHENGQPCVCGGKGTQRAELHGLRLEVIRLQCAALRGDAEKGTNG